MERFTLDIDGIPVALSQPLLDLGGSVSFFSPTVDTIPDTQPGNIDDTMLDLQSRDMSNVPLHISFRREAKEAIFNSCSGGEWGPEEKKSIDGTFSMGLATAVVVREKDNEFEIFFNGSLFYTYTKRLIYVSVQVLTYTKSSSSQKTALFAPTLAITVGPISLPAYHNFQDAYFQLTTEDVADESELSPFDIVIVGSGFGGGVLAYSLLEKNKTLMESEFREQSTPDVPKHPRWQVPMPREPEDTTTPLRILIIEKGGLLFHTHCLNTSRPSVNGMTSQANELMFPSFKERVDMDDSTKLIWEGGPVHCLGGRGALWGLFSPRVSIDTLQAQFPPDVTSALLDEYYLRAEQMVEVEYPKTLPPHQALIDRLNRPASSDLPSQQWQWGRIASQFRNNSNYEFPRGAFSPIDKILEAAMNDPTGQKNPFFRAILNTPAVRLEPAPKPGEKPEVTHVVVKDGDVERRIACKQAVISAGSIESSALLLRTANGCPGDFGEGFTESFGHITDHRIMSVAMPFFYHNMRDREIIGGMKIQTEIPFHFGMGDAVDNSVALGNIALDTDSFLPREDPSHGLFPVLVLLFILPTPLATENTIELNCEQEPRIHVRWAPDPYLKEKKKLLLNFSADVMNKVANVFDVRFVQKTDKGYTPFLNAITADVLHLHEYGPGSVAHEMGSIPMPNAKGTGGIVDNNLRMQYGWSNVSVCDLSVFPYSPAANPTLTLSALALRLSDRLFPVPTYSPITVYNLTERGVPLSFFQGRVHPGNWLSRRL